MRTPPLPPPFIPQAVEVALGTSGETLTLITTEAGGYTLNGEAFVSGTSVMASNGSTYTLALEGASWRAAYSAPAPIRVLLGATGEMISIDRSEDGRYQSNGNAIENGTVITAENGNMYRVVIRDDGMFIAEFVSPSDQDR